MVPEPLVFIRSKTSSSTYGIPRKPQRLSVLANSTSSMLTMLPASSSNSGASSETMQSAPRSSA